METYQAFYKCRLCGKVFGAQRKDRITAISEIAITVCGFDDKRKVPNQTIHICDNGESLGIADFQGFRKVE